MTKLQVKASYKLSESAKKAPPKPKKKVMKKPAKKVTKPKTASAPKVKVGVASPKCKPWELEIVFVLHFLPFESCAPAENYHQDREKASNPQVHGEQLTS